MQAVMSLCEHVFVLARRAHHRAGRAGARSRATRRWSRPISAMAPRPNRRGVRQATVTPCSTCAISPPATAATEVLRGVDLAVAPGEIVAVLGSNGVGKTTLNSALSGIVRARAGAIRFDGRCIDGA